MLLTVVGLLVGLAGCDDDSSAPAGATRAATIAARCTSAASASERAIPLVRQPFTFAVAEHQLSGAVFPRSRSVVVCVAARR